MFGPRGILNAYHSARHVEVTPRIFQMHAEKHECTDAEKHKSMNELVNHSFGGLCCCTI